MHHIGYLLSDGFQVMALGTQTVFEFANLVFGKTFYSVGNYSIDGHAICSSLGLVVTTDIADERVQADTWMVLGVADPLVDPPAPELVRCLRERAATARRVASICTGAFTAAEAGLLSGRRATTHWAFAGELQCRFPDITVEDDRIYIVDGPMWTSAGMTAGLDLALALVEKDLGDDVARSVAHKLVMHQRRSGGQSQHSELLALAPKSDRIQNALDYARTQLKRQLSVEELAERVHLSPRQFTRVFTAETGQSPAKAIERLRLESARLLIERSQHDLEEIARETGFRDRRHMREAFLRGYGIPPQAIRQGSRG